MLKRIGRDSKRGRRSTDKEVMIVTGRDRIKERKKEQKKVR